MRRLLFVLAVGLGSASVAQAQTCSEPYTVVLNEQYSGVTWAEAHVLTKEVDYCVAWDLIYSNRFPPPPCDTSLVDFSTQVALVASIGSRPDGCHGVDVACVTRTPTDRIGIALAEVVPGPTCICTDAIVDPVLIVAVDKPVTGGQLAWTTQTLSCP